MREGSLSSGGGENEGSRWRGGCGNRESENVEGVGVVCASLKQVLSDEKLKGPGNCDCRRRFSGPCPRRGQSETKPMAVEGFGSLFLVLKKRTLVRELTVESLNTLLP